MPNLENLKKQAKLYLRWHRDRHYPVAAQIRARLPRFGHLSDREALAHSFKLSDAQELVAKKDRIRELGGAPQRTPSPD